MDVVLILYKELITVSEKENIQGDQENFEAPGQKRRMSPPASKASRKFSGSRNYLCKITADTLYEAPRP